MPTPQQNATQSRAQKTGHHHPIAAMTSYQSSGVKCTPWTLAQQQKCMPIKEIQTWAEMAKEAKAQVKHAHNEIKENTLCTEVMKKQKGITVLRWK